jgi:hypothetical protein
MFDHLNRAIHGARGSQPAAGRQPTVDTLLPGDVVSLWDGGDLMVQSVLECQEEVNQRVTTWRWSLLDEGRMLEASPDGTFLYGRTVVLHQSSAEFETLTADPDEGGVLKAFEARVRLGTAARNPVLFEYDAATYRVTATGSFGARPIDGPYPKNEVWRDLDPTNSGENVYFVLEPTDEAAVKPDESVVLGIWTTHIALLFGSALKEADIQSIYPRSEERQTR